MRKFFLTALAGLALVSCGNNTSDGTGSPATAPGNDAGETAPCCDVTLLVQVPAGTPTLYLTGDLEEWGPWDPAAVEMTGTGEMREVSFRLPEGSVLEYKFTLGTWESEALGPSGMVMGNNRLRVKGDMEKLHVINDFKRPVADYIADWQGSGVQGELVYWTDVESAHLTPTRHVSVWLPPEYEAQPEARFPVLYMSDGQNLFDPRIANTGVDWGVDEAVGRLVKAGKIPPIIVVGVWSTDERGTEYSPWHDADNYAQFLISELMPRVNEEFRTLTGPENTAVMGSSMGGLLSFYLVNNHPDLFGACGCVSTHFPLSEEMAANYFGNFSADNPSSEPYIRQDIADGLTPPAGVRYWFDYGTKGLDAAYEPIHDEVKAWLLAEGLVEDDDFVMKKYPGADHNETAWRNRVIDPLTFLFGDYVDTGY